jgi:hypothetical protein
MKTLHLRAIFLVAVSLALSACARESKLEVAARSVEKRLAWVEHANVAALYQADHQKGIRRFMLVCGYSCVAPGVGSLTTERCFPGVENEPIEGTSDVVLSARHKELMARAYVVAKQYNALVAESEAKTGQSTCPSGADVDAAFHEIGSQFRAAFPTASESAFRMGAGALMFELVPPSGHVSTSFEQAACAALSKHRLPARTRIAIFPSLEAKATTQYLCGPPLNALTS